MEGLRGQLVDGSEKRHLLKKPFLPRAVRREVVEVLSDFVTAHHDGGFKSLDGVREDLQRVPAAVRALWYQCSLFEPRFDSGEGKFDAYEMVSSREVFGFDIRSFRNVQIVFTTLVLYLGEAKPALFPNKELDMFVGRASASDEAARLLLASLSAEGLLTVQRVAELLAHLSRDGQDAEALQQLSLLVASRLIRSEDSTTSASEGLRAAVLACIVAKRREIFPKAYASTRARLGQGIHYTPRVLRQNEVDIILEGSKLAK